MEKEEIKRDGAKPQKNSGRGQIQKGDATKGSFCYDIKEYGKTFTLSEGVWAKISTDAFKSGNYEPALKIVLGTGNRKTRVWVFGEEMGNQMMELWEERYGRGHS
jgi:hypothetical protein